jgi:hypothetical protein
LAAETHPVVGGKWGFSQLQYRHGICGVMGVWAAIAALELWEKYPCLTVSLTEIFDFL